MSFLKGLPAQVLLQILDHVDLRTIWNLVKVGAPLSELVCKITPGGSDDESSAAKNSIVTCVSSPEDASSYPIMIVDLYGSDLHHHFNFVEFESYYRKRRRFIFIGVKVGQRDFFEIYEYWTRIFREINNFSKGLNSILSTHDKEDYSSNGDVCHIIFYCDQNPTSDEEKIRYYDNIYIEGNMGITCDLVLPKGFDLRFVMISAYSHPGVFKFRFAERPSIERLILRSSGDYMPTLGMILEGSASSSLILDSLESVEVDVSSPYDGKLKPLPSFPLARPVIGSRLKTLCLRCAWVHPSCRLIDQVNLPSLETLELTLCGRGAYRNIIGNLTARKLNKFVLTLNKTYDFGEILFGTVNFGKTIEFTRIAIGKYEDRNKKYFRNKLEDDSVLMKVIQSTKRLEFDGLGFHNLSSLKSYKAEEVTMVLPIHDFLESNNVHQDFNFPKLKSLDVNIAVVNMRAYKKKALCEFNPLNHPSLTSLSVFMNLTESSWSKDYWTKKITFMEPENRSPWVNLEELEFYNFTSDLTPFYKLRKLKSAKLANFFDTLTRPDSNPELTIDLGQFKVQELKIRYGSPTLPYFLQERKLDLQLESFPVGAQSLAISSCRLLNGSGIDLTFNPVLEEIEKPARKRRKTSSRNLPTK